MCLEYRLLTNWLTIECKKGDIASGKSIWSMLENKFEGVRGARGRVKTNDVRLCWNGRNLSPNRGY